MLEAVDLSCERGGRTLFSGLSFTLAPGQALLVTGPNGAGKTSLLRILCGLSPPFTGEVRWRGQGLAAAADRLRGALFYLGHHNGIKDELTALENLHINATLAGDALSEEAARAALAGMGLVGREDLPAKTLSQGQRRRVALARLLVSHAPLWVLDEPLTALDSRAAALIESRLVAHLAEGGLVVLTTHQPIDLPEIALRRLTLGEA